MLIFGWGHQTTKNFGPTFKNRCGHCNNDDYFVLSRIITWFTLFFIPVIPYSIKYFLSCPICQYGINPSSEQIKEIKPVAEANQALINGEITKEEYQLRLNQSTNNTPDTKPQEQLTTKENLTKETKSKINFCSKCGDKLEYGSKFCSKCGIKIK